MVDQVRRPSWLPLLFVGAKAAGACRKRGLRLGQGLAEGQGFEPWRVFQLCRFSMPL